MSTHTTDQLIDAARHNDLEKVRDLIPVSDPKTDDSLALWWASKNGNIEMVELLMPVSDVSAYHNEALRIASKNNHANIIKLLLPHCNIHDAKSIVSPLYIAIQHEFFDEARTLIRVHDIDWNDDFFFRHTSGDQQAYQTLQAMHEELVLSQHMPDKNFFKTKSKI